MKMILNKRKLAWSYTLCRKVIVLKPGRRSSSMGQFKRSKLV
jgi:hypothetical protein